MELKFLVNHIQVMDMAPWDEAKGRLVDDVLKIGETISTSPSVIVKDIGLISRSKTDEKKLELKDGITYDISGKILGGYPLGDVYLVVDCGIPLRVCVRVPREYFWEPSSTGRTAILIKKPESELKRFTFRKGDFISFTSKIEAMWLDTWEGAIRTAVYGSILNREVLENDDLILTVECQPQSQPLVEYGPYGKPSMLIDDDSDEFTVEY